MQYIGNLHLTTSSAPYQLQLNGFPVSDIAALLALIVAAFAAWQALKSARATAQANIQAVLPVISLEYKELDGDIAAELFAKNMGQGQAFNVKFGPCKKYLLADFTQDDRYVLCDLRLRLAPNDIEPRTKRRLVVTGYEDGKPADGGVLTLIMAGSQKRMLRFPVFYQDVVGNRYVTYVETGKGVVRIVRPSRRLGFTTILLRIWFEGPIFVHNMRVTISWRLNRYLRR